MKANPLPGPAHPAPPASPVVEMLDLMIGAVNSPETIVLEGVNWTIADADYWVVGGLHGSGKSDLLATAAGLNRPLRGALRLFGNDTAGLAEAELLEARLRIALVFENGGRLLHHLTVAENIALPLCYHRNCPPSDARGRVDEILNFTRLTPLARCAPGQINLAWQQRAALARALASAPGVLLLDNPLAGLGPQEARWWRASLAELSQGHPIMNGRPVALVVACNDLRPWVGQGKQFALLSRKRWCPIGGRTDLAGCAEPLLRDLLAADFKTG